MLLILKVRRKRETPGTILADSFIFPGEAGIFEARDPNAATRRVKRFMKAHGLPDLSPHDLRHSCATLLLGNGGGTTNAFIAQELGCDVEPGLCTVGSSTDGLLCVTEPSSRKSFPNVFYKGQPVEKTIAEALQDYHADTVIIKGANAFDQDGHVGVITSGFNGGTVPNFIGYMTSKGLKWICPVGYEKMVPSVPAASRALGGANHIDISMGADPGLYCLSSADILTEVEAIKAMFNCEAKAVCAGGIGGNEGAHYWAVDGEETDIKALVDFLEQSIKGEPPVRGSKGNCANCRYPGCRYNGLTPDQLPAWMKKRGIEK